MAHAASSASSLNVARVKRADCAILAEMRQLRTSRPRPSGIIASRISKTVSRCCAVCSDCGPSNIHWYSTTAESRPAQLAKVRRGSAVCAAAEEATRGRQSAAISAYAFMPVMIKRRWVKKCSKIRQNKNFFRYVFSVCRAHSHHHDPVMKQGIRPEATRAALTKTRDPKAALWCAFL